MKNKFTTLFVLFCLLISGRLNAQFLLLDDMEGNGLCSGRWTYYAGAGATGSVQFNVPNPQPSGLNTSSHVARFIKDTSCFEYMSANCSMLQPFDLTANSVFKMLVYASTKDEILFKLQPGSDYTKAVYFTYKVSQINRWEEATFNFQSVSHRTDLNYIGIHYIDGQKAAGTLYFDLVQAPNPTGVTLTNTTVAMGQEHGTVLQAKVNGDIFSSTLNTANWTALNLPQGVSIDSVHRVNDSIATITLSGNSPANYSRTVLQLQIDSAELQNPNTAIYLAKGNVVFEGNPAWTMIYQDEFNTDGLPDRSKWTVDPRPKGWINGEQQVYTDTTHDNIRVENGKLIIKGKKDFPNGNSNEPWSSGRMISQGKMDFLYGKVEVLAKLPRARGSWPAIWLMPTTSAYGGWPRSGEIDIMEHVGNNYGNVLSTVHTQNNNWMNGGHLSGSRSIPDAADNYHLYAVEWSPDSLRFSYDSIHVYTYANPQTDWKDWPFDQKFHIILNVAIGGGMGGSIFEADWPDSMMVDYVRVYQKGLGTPVLDSVVVTPKDLSFVPGKTQQYTAKAFDQNEHDMPITPVWSITGAGNTIDSTGLATLQTSGVVTATATVDSVTVSGSTNFNVRPVNYKPVPARIEAEDFDNGNVCCTETTQDTSGALNVSYIGAGTWMEYDIDVPSAGDYRLRFRVAVSYNTSLKVQLDTATLATVALPASGGWQNWISVASAPLHLEAGQQTIRIWSGASGWNFNWLEIVDAADVALARIDITPDSVKLVAGNTRQFTAKGYDADSNLVSITPVWSVTGTANEIDSAGLFTSGAVTGIYTISATAECVTGTAIAEVTPVPVLTRIAISPDTIMVPLNASQQFTATAYDQFDSAMSETPAIVWAVSGSGNTISADGILTAGNNPGTYTVTATADTVSGTAVVTTGYTCTVNNKHEAESSSNYASGPYLETCTDVGGGQNFAGLNSGKWFAYNTLNVPVAGRYRISLRVLSTTAASVKIGHSGYTFGTISIPSTGGVWKTVSDTITLPALTYTGIHVMSGSFKFNWFSIDNCADEPQVLTRIEVTPDSVDVAAGGYQQFTATGYDADSNTMVLPAVTWSVSGTGNSITAGGLLTAGLTSGTYTVTAAADSISGTASVNVVANACTVNDKYEAETASAKAPGPYLQPCTDIGGGQNYAGLWVNDYFAYNTLNVPAPGLYNISFRVSTTAPAQIRVGHSGMVFGTIDVPSTGGAWQTITDTITLPALSYTGIHVHSGTFKFNWFSIDNCAPDSLNAGGMAFVKPEETKGTIGARLYPNPVNSMAVVEMSADVYRTATLLDMQGKMVRRWNISSGQARLDLDLGFLQRGMYILKLEGDRETESLRLIRL